MKDLDKIAATYHSAGLPDMHIEEACQRYELEWLIDAIPTKVDRILDLGYGDGINFERLIVEKSLVMVDGSRQLCEQAQARGEKTQQAKPFQVVCSMFEEFDSDEKFGAIVASHVLEHVDNPVELLKRLKKNLARDGLIIGIVPNSESLHRRLGVLMGLQRRLDDLSPRDHIVGHQRVYSLESLTSDLANAGFEVLSHRGFFVKTLSNAQLTQLSASVLTGLLQLSDTLPTELCANIGFVGQAK